MCRISSTGRANYYQSNRVGEYRVTGVLADRPIYKHVAKEEFVFFLTSKARGLWMVGPKPGHYNGGLAHKGEWPKFPLKIFNTFGVAMNF
jgi:hypothetical protein